MKTQLLRIGLFLACALAAVPGHAQSVTLTANCSAISGVDTVGDYWTAPVSIFDGPTLIATTRASGGGGYSLSTPSALKDNQPHQLSAQVVDGGSTYVSSTFALTCPVNAPGYVYDFTDTFSSINTTNWQVNGQTPTLSGGLTNASSTGSALIYKPAVPGVANAYEVKMTLALLTSGGVYSSYLRATTNAVESPNQGSYYVVELQNPHPGGTGTLNVYVVISGSASLYASTTVPCHNGMTIRSVFSQSSTLTVYVDNWYWITCPNQTAITSGQPGVGVRSAPAGNAIVEADIGHLDTVVPSAPNGSTVAVSTVPNRVDLRWAGTADDANGTGVSMYWVGRQGGGAVWVTDPEYEDATVAAGSAYTYMISACDYHGNCNGPTFVNVTTPPAGSIDPRRVGIAALGNYWGGAGENIDLRSDNLNYTIPLVKPVGMLGMSVPINLSYNSQFWRQEAGNTWRLVNATGHGLGWTVQAGSLTPVYDNLTWNAPLYYLFVDTTGAEYRLDQVSSGVYSSTQSIYVWFDSNTHRLWFKDGSFWLFGCMSGGTEGDAGTLYPTTIEDQLGNHIAIRYDQGAGTAWPDSSSRISEIEDSRATQNGPSGLPATYVFTNTGGVLTGITNKVASNETYTFTQQTTNLNSPFTGSFFSTSAELTSLSRTSTGETTSFAYDSSAELTKVTFPNGGYLRWSYTTQQYTGNIWLNEVQNRYLEMAAGGSTEYSHTFSHDPGDTGRSFHYCTLLTDVSGNGSKNWFFNLTGSSSNLLGAPSSLYEYTTNDPVWQPMVTVWSYAQDAATNWYVQSTSINLNVSQPNQIVKQTTQTVDRYGNATQIKQYDWGASSPSRTYTNTWLEGADGNPSSWDTKYFRNRLLTSTVTDGTNTVTLVSNTYNSIAQITNSTTPATAASYTYDNYGNVTGQTTNGLATSITMDTTHNSVVPSLVTTGSNSATLQWSSFLGLNQNTGQNGDAAGISYDGNGFPASTTSPYGATTNNAYTIYNSGTGAPTTMTSTTNTHYTQQTLDGVGHVIKQITGTVSGSTYTPVSEVDSVYAPCACSPMGKLQKVSLPYTPGGSVYWTTYAYDGLGRTISVTLTDGSATNYVYDDMVPGTDAAASYVRVTDPAGVQKRYQMDAFGHLTRATEDPHGVAYATTYGYDLLDHLIQVQQTRGSVTQTRTFNYKSGTTLTPYLQSATNPENGTVNYTYNSDGTLATKKDARNQQVSYTYDSFKRLTKITRGGGQDVNLYYDANPFDPPTGGFTHNAMGRLAAVQYYAGSPHTFIEMYSYTAPGEATGKRLQVTYNCQWSGIGYNPCSSAKVFNLDGHWTWDTEGRMITQTWPLDSAGTNPSVTYGYDTMGRPNTLSETVYSNGNPIITNPVTGVTYNAAGEPLSYGSETWTYNTLGQVATHTASNYLSVQYAYPTGQNNGKIASRTNVLSGEDVQYTYDSLNRLIQAQTAANQNVTQWGQSFVYDGFGNLLQKNATKGSVPTLQVTVDSGNHVISTGVTYDAAGNITQMNLKGTPQPLNWDADSRLVGVLSGGPNGSDLYLYGYDKNNQRVWQRNWLTDTFFFYGIDGRRMGGYSLQGTNTLLTIATGATPEIYFLGRLVGQNQDQVGSVAGGGGTPYGEGYTSGSDFYAATGFATYTSDATGLDYANNRYYSSTLGRFLSADPYMANNGGPGDPRNPKTWNRYSYAGNDPLNFNDQTGNYMVEVDNWETSCSGPEDDQDCDEAMVPSYYIMNGWPGNQTRSQNPVQHAAKFGAVLDALNQLLISEWQMFDSNGMSEPCGDDLAALNVTPAAMAEGLAGVNILDGQGSTVPAADLQKSGTAQWITDTTRNLMVGNDFGKNSNTSAEGSLNDNRVFINANLIKPAADPYNAGLLMHEVLHNVTGLNDSQIQAVFWGPNSSQVGAPSENIGIKLRNDCFPNPTGMNNE